MPPDLYSYLGAQEFTYPAYLQVAEDGTTSTLIGTPGMDPVAIRRAAGNDTLPEIPGDGHWSPTTSPKDQAPAQAAPGDEAKSTAKSRKAVA